MNRLPQSFDEFLAMPPQKTWRGDRFIRLHISRNTLIAFLLSILVHGLILLMALPVLNQGQKVATGTMPMQISLASPKKAPNPVEVQAEPAIEIPAPEPVKEAPKKVEKNPKVISQKPDVKPRPTFTVPKELIKEIPKEMTPEKAPLIEKPAEAPTDMMAYVKSKRAERLAQGDAAEQNAAAIASETGPSEEEKRIEKIKNNMKSGTNGIFEITSLSGRNGTFAFRGWTGDYSNARLQFFEVEAKSGQDIRLIMIRRMIALIREHYQGDFNWESHRLGRVITLSARLEDGSGLEDFMMTEFFGPNYKNI